MSDVLIRIEGAIGHLTLNRPKALNALTTDMVHEISKALLTWQDDPEVKLIVLDGAGDRGLCAGGDIRALYDASKAQDYAAPETFFRDEFLLNARIGGYSKPFVAFMDGIVMGGGIGLSSHASHRIVTERSTMAMPEVGIGYFPDVGGTYLLSRAPGELGTHAALTAGRLNAADAIDCQLADVQVPSAKLAELLEALKGIATGDDAWDIIGKFTEPSSGGTLVAARGWIDPCYSADTVEEIVARLQARSEPEAQKTAETILKQSPTSLKVTLKALRDGRRFGRLESCLNQEYDMARAFIRGHEFVEGVRAAVVDKDRQPKWVPASLSEVGPEIVDRHFHSPDGTTLGL